MKLGILADIHEDAPRLAQALQHFQRAGVDQVVVLGDVVYSLGSQLQDTIALLRAAGAIGVWGNHDLGLCLVPDEGLQARFAGPVVDFMHTLRPRLQLDDCLFTHGLAHWDAMDPAIFYLGEEPESSAGRAESFTATTQSVLFMGHFHRWLAATPEGCLSWDGTTPLQMFAHRRYFVVISAVCAGWCAIFDTVTRVLEPHQILP